MAKIVINNATGISSINANFDKVETEFNTKVLYRDNPEGEANEMLVTLDMNENRIINLPAPMSPNEPARIQDVLDNIVTYPSIYDEGILKAASAKTINFVGAEVTADAVGFDATVTVLSTAGNTSNTPSGNVSATTVQAAITELDQEKTQSVGNVAALRLLSKTGGSRGAVLLGYYVFGDSGGGARYWLDLADTTTADNGGSVIVAADGGRWKMVERSTMYAEQFGAKGDGSTTDTVAIQSAKDALVSGGILKFGTGTFLVDTDAALTVNVPNVTIEGTGPSTIIKAKNSANLSNVIALAATGCTVKNLVVDGNRTNSGTSPSVSYGVFIGFSTTLIENVEVRECTRVGAFMGSGVSTPININYINCWFHDNGGNVNGGIGVGIYGGGSFPANYIKIEGCRFENNYNLFAGFPGDSTAVNIQAKDVIFNNNYVKNNHNVQGGQIAFTSDGSTGIPDGRFIVTNNTIIHDVTVAGEATSGIEIEGKKAIVADNIVQSANGDAIRLETSGGDTIVANNICNGNANGINLIQVGGTGVSKVIVHDNLVMSGSTGISIQANPGNVFVRDNYIDASVTTKIAGAANCALVRGNSGYVPANSASLIAGTSPYTYPALNVDAVYALVAPNGISAATLTGGFSVPITFLTPIPVSAGDQLTVTWSGTAPHYAYHPQQQ